MKNLIANINTKYHLTMNNPFAYITPTRRLKNPIAIVLFLLLVMTAIVSLGAFEIKPFGSISVNNGSNRFLAFHSKMVEGHYNLSTYSQNWKILASIDEPMPARTKLLIQVSSKKGTSLGIVDLSDGTPKNVVIGNGKVVETDQCISCTVISGTRLGRTVTLNLREW
ncbi:MAG: hypothetical protein NTX44_02065 [Ignavibacteriales bacterium]|nr:hypothetical protein [Ignavibacteriales bacterium]